MRLFDVHDQAFTRFKGICSRGIYDNMKAVVETIFIGEESSLQSPLPADEQTPSVDPVACTPVSDWEKGEVENQVG